MIRTPFTKFPFSKIFYLTRKSIIDYVYVYGNATLTFLKD